MANIAALLKRIESGTLSYEEKLSALSQVEQSLQDMRQKKQEAIQSNVMLIVDALKQMQVKVEQQLEEAKAIVPQKGQKGDKGDKGDRGLDGAPGKDGRNGIDGKDGKDGNDGISVTDAKIDFDGSLVITLSNGREINVGEVLPLEVSDKIKVIANGGGTSQTVVDTLTSLQNQINTLTGVDGVLGDMAQQNANNVAITGGAINGATIGGVTPAAGTFTTLTATGQTSLGGVAGSESLRVVVGTTNGSYSQVTGGASYVEFRTLGTNPNNSMLLVSRGTGTISFFTNNSTSNEQFRVSPTASAVNYVQVTGGATGGYARVTAQGSDTNVPLYLAAKNSAEVLVAGSQFNAAAPVYLGTNLTNYWVGVGSATGNALRFQATGTDSNISMAFVSKGTGAIDLAAGSSGVNISNGGTVTALTVTASGSSYTSIPTPAITAPTTAGGVQAVATATMLVGSGSTVGSGGTGYTVNDTLTAVGGTFTTAATFTVTAVSGGVVTAVTNNAGGTYSVLPTNPVSTTGGTGTGCTINITSWGVRGLTIGTAGSGYVEQPTVTFSGGGGSGAAAYATVGSVPKIQTLATQLDFFTPGGRSFMVEDGAVAQTGYIKVTGSTTSPYLTATGSATDVNFALYTKGAGTFQFKTNFSPTQFQVSHTASAVNYVQVTGAATGGSPRITAQGSDTNIGLLMGMKGWSSIQFWGANQIFQMGQTTATPANYLQTLATASGSGPSINAVGTDTNIDLTLTTKGTGAVNLNTGGGTQFSVANTAGATNYFATTGSNGGTPALYSAGASTNIGANFVSKGTGSLAFYTNGSVAQLVASHTASAVNYVQVTGAATGGAPTISAQGSDAASSLIITSKGGGDAFFRTGSTGGFIRLQPNAVDGFQVSGVASGVNYLRATNAVATAAPILSAQGTDTNIDLALTPKGTGRVKFGTHTATADTAVSGYIEIVDSGGTVRKLAVIT